MSKRTFAAGIATTVGVVLLIVPLVAAGQQGRAPDAKPGPPPPAVVAPLPPPVEDDEEPAPEDQVILDDFIVSGNTCLGVDCFNGEQFSYDSLRIKEKIPRLKLMDSSTVSGFPNQDWQIEANARARFGDEYIGIRDCGDSFVTGDTCGGTLVFRIDAGARPDALRIDSQGHLGLGTDPRLDFHAVTGDSPGIRLQQDGSASFTPQTWDIVGNEANFFVRDADTGDLPFRIRPDAPENALVIEENGDIGMGIQFPSAPLHISRPSLPSLRMTASTSGHVWDVSVTDNGALFYNKLADPNIEMRVSGNGDLRIEGRLLAENGDGSIDPGDTFPDYVFAPGYALMGIGELAAFIEANGHLPGVMTADDVSAAGAVDMTTLQLQLLEKVEELTLHTISLHQRIAQLEADNARLRARGN